jgi:hypothetical protein
MLYQQCKDSFGNILTTCIKRIVDNAFIPTDPDNTDYQTFRKEILAGAELQDADGNVMTQAEADAFIATLP